MKTLRSMNPRWLLALLFVSCLISLTGCSSTEPENLSERPWNAPNGTENGLPMGLMQGH
jgi:hypothetical protein